MTGTGLITMIRRSTSSGRSGKMQGSRDEMRDIEAIKQLKARYFRLMDTKQWEAFASVFAEDAEIDVTDDAGPETGRVRGGPAIANYIRSAIGEAFTVHHGHMPEIRITGSATAEGIWAMFDYVEFPSEGTRRGLKGYGHYIETYTRCDGDWKIQSMKLSRLRIDPLPPDAGAS